MKVFDIDSLIKMLKNDVILNEQLVAKGRQRLKVKEPVWVGEQCCHTGQMEVDRGKDERLKGSCPDVELRFETCAFHCESGIQLLSMNSLIRSLIIFVGMEE